MFRTLIIGLTALGLAAAGAPDRAKADNSDLAAGAIFGALLGGVLVATIDNDRKRDRGYYYDGRRPAYYAPPPRYYGNRPYYGDRYRHGRDVHVYHHRAPAYQNRRYAPVYAPRKSYRDRDWRHDRRHDRREVRHDRRYDRREARHDRREWRQDRRDRNARNAAALRRDVQLRRAGLLN